MTKRISMISIAVVICLLTFNLMGGLGTGDKAKGDSKINPLDKVTLAYVNTTHAVLAGVALKKGYFLEEGLEVIPREHSYGKSAMMDMLQGNADFATVADPPIMMGIMEGEKIAIVATIQTSNKDNAILAIKDEGLLHPRDLKGRRIGVTAGTTSDFFMDSFLMSVGIGQKDVEKINLEPERLYDALIEGHVEAVSAFQPFLAIMQSKLGEKAISFYDENIYTWTFSVVAQQKYVRQNPEKVQKLLRALIRAEEFVNRRSGEAQEIVAGYSGMEIELVGKIWSHMRFAVTLDQFLVLALEDESRWAINTGMVRNRITPNYLDYFYFEGLESVKPKAVRILGRRIDGN